MIFSLPQDSAMRSKDFTYGVATASFQIEGGYESRLPCIWDTFCATDGKIADGSDGKLACDHFNRWQDDIELIASLGVDAYRFSIAWGRVIQQDGSLNPQGVAFYQNILSALKARNIKAYVTLYHWDLPQHIEDNGGWLNRETAYLFADYADKISAALGADVYSFATLNEPFCSSFLGYEIGIHAPGKTSKAAGRQSAHHLLLAHGLAIKVLQKNCPHAVNGIVLNFTPCYSVDDDPANQAATQMADDYFNQWYVQPVMTGEYPALLQQLPAEQQPDIQAGDMEIISQPLDFLGVNFYTRAVYRACPEQGYVEIAATDASRNEVPVTDMGWEIYPQAFTELLVSLHQKYQLPPVVITENGAATVDAVVEHKVDDQIRINYYQQHLNAVNTAIEQGVDVRGYFAWSLMDNFEWAEGYRKRFGIVYVDYQSQQRTIKNSGNCYQQLLANRLATPSKSI